MYQLVILDLDNTLYDENDYFRAIFSSFEDDIGITPETLYNSFLEINRSKSTDVLGDTLKVAQVYSKDMHERLFHFYKSENIHLNLPERTREFLKKLKEMSVSTCILTNGVVEVQKNKVKSLDIEKLVSKVVYARNNVEKIEKPDVRVFKKVLEHFMLPCSEALMVGDSYSNDYKGGMDAGLKSLWFKGNGNDSVNSLREVLAYIEGKNEKN